MGAQWNKGLAVLLIIFISLVLVMEIKRSKGIGRTSDFVGDKEERIRSYTPQQDSHIDAQYLEKQFESVRIQFEETKGLLQQQSSNSNNGNTVEETLKLEMRLQEESKAKEDLQSRLAKETLAKLGLEKEVLSLKSEQTNSINTVSYKSTRQPIKVLYRDLSHCAKPKYLPEYTSHCWGQCRKDETCSEPPTAADIAAGKAALKCFEDFYLLGVRKCGTQDISQWFKTRKNIVLNKQGVHGWIKAGDYYPHSKKCPMEYFAELFPDSTQLQTTDLIYHDGPGTLLTRALVGQNSTHMTVAPATQFLGFMATAKTKFHIQIRHPTDRAISYLYEWKKGGTIFRNITHEQFNQEFTEFLLLGCLEDIKHCLATYGELGCVYRTQGNDGIMINLLKHSLYVIYLEEAYKFIPREQIVISRTEDYATSEEEVMKRVMQVFDIEFEKEAEVSDINSKNVVNRGKKNPVSERVIKALDNFYMPFNQRLAKLLNDDRFLWLRT